MGTGRKYTEALKRRNGEYGFDLLNFSTATPTATSATVAPSRGDAWTGFMAIGGSPAQIKASPATGAYYSADGSNLTGGIKTETFSFVPGRYTAIAVGAPSTHPRIVMAFLEE